MRIVKVSVKAITAAPLGPAGGRTLHIPVTVDWPELQLTDAQRLANAAARVAGVATPYPDQSLFTLEVPYVVPA